MLIVGLTGGFGSGKSTVARMFADFGANILDADSIVHDLLEKKGPCQSQVKQAFPQAHKAGGIDRRILADIVFNHPNKLKKLTGILHPEVKRRLWYELNKKRNKKNAIAVLEVPLLIETGWHREMDVIIVVKSTQKHQIQRSAKRLNMKQASVRKRIDAQLPLKEKLRYADFIIDNNDSINKTKTQVRNIWQKLQQMEKE